MTMHGGESRATILLADDEEDLRAMLERGLDANGFDIVAVADGAAALEYLAAAADGTVAMPDLLLVDFVMPELSGIGMLRTLRRFVKLPPAILMTGFPDRSVETCARSAGVVRVVRKPLEMNELLDTIADVLGPERRTIPLLQGAQHVPRP